MANADGGLARITPDNHEFHAFAEGVGKCSHYASLLCLFIFLVTLGWGSALFDIGGKLFPSILTVKKNEWLSCISPPQRPRQIVISAMPRGRSRASHTQP